ncbi:MAG: DUF6128 domain-containing protein, partial [Eubacteriales bacterium]|nr:DUF6128 domain-containing protein [Eubacteriales bacterium]
EKEKKEEDEGKCGEDAEKRECEEGKEKEKKEEDEGKCGEDAEKKECEEGWEKEEKEESDIEKAEVEKPLPQKKDTFFEKMWIELQEKGRKVDNIFNPAFGQGVQITIEQLEMLPPEERELANNQFLKNGYRIYQHLLAGKVRYGGEERYCVGVPGIYGNRERYMAQIYQFPLFLSMTENRIKTGGFGYWLHLLSAQSNE